MCTFFSFLKLLNVLSFFPGSDLYEIYRKEEIYGLLLSFLASSARRGARPRAASLLASRARSFRSSFDYAICCLFFFFSSRSTSSSTVMKMMISKAAAAPQLHNNANLEAFQDFLPFVEERSAKPATTTAEAMER